VRLKEIRKSKGYTRETLASASGVSPMTVWRIETGKRPGSLDVWRKFAEVLETPLAELIDEGSAA
jgi:transcriptional regulator with XRE-family HTH domain